MIKSRTAGVVLTAALGTASAALLAGTNGIAWQDPIEIAAGDAYQGPWRMNESDFRYVDDASVAVNDAGRIGIVWANNAEKDIYFQQVGTDGRRHPAEPVNVSRSPDTFSWLPRVILGEGDANDVHILWQEIVFSGGSHGGEIFFARSADGGQSFSDPINLSNTTAGAGKGRLTEHHWDNGSLDIAKDADGHLHAAWTEYEGRLWYSRSSDNGKTFSQPLHVAGSDREPARGPTLAAADDATVYLAWTVGEDPAADIRIAISEDRGQSFGEPRRVHRSDGHADAPKLAVDAAGTVHLVYAESPAGPGRSYHIQYMRSTNGGRSFDQPVRISAPLDQEFDSTNFPSLALDGAGNPHVIWELYPDARNRPQGLGISYSTNGGDDFVSPAIVPGSLDPALGINGSLQGLLANKLAVNRRGQITVVNSTFNWGESSHVWLFRGQTKPQ